MSNVRAVSDDTFEREVLQAEGKVVVDFWAEWCRPCKVVSPEIDRLAEQYTSITFLKCDVDNSPNVAAKYHILGIPTIAVFEGGNLLATAVGAKTAEAIAKELELG